MWGVLCVEFFGLTMRFGSDLQREFGSFSRPRRRGRAQRYQHASPLRRQRRSDTLRCSKAEKSQTNHRRNHRCLPRVRRPLSESSEADPEKSRDDAPSSDSESPESSSSNSSMPEPAPDDAAKDTGPSPSPARSRHYRCPRSSPGRAASATAGRAAPASAAAGRPSSSSTLRFRRAPARLARCAIPPPVIVSASSSGSYRVRRPPPCPPHDTFVTRPVNSPSSGTAPDRRSTASAIPLPTSHIRP